MDIKNNTFVISYLNEVCAAIKNRRVHSDIREELLNHIEDAYLYNKEKGMEDEKAVELAIKSMGAARLVGKGLNKVHRQLPDLAILAFTLLFSLMGIGIIYCLQSNGIHISTLYKSISLTALGTLVFAFFTIIDYRKIKLYSKYLYILNISIVVISMLLGSKIHGRSTLAIGPLNITVESILLVLSIVSLAGILDNWDWENIKKGLLALGLILLPAFLFLTIPSISHFIIYMIAMLPILILSKFQFKKYFPYMLPLFMLFVLFVFQNSAGIMRRLYILFNPNSDAAGSGYIYMQLQRIVHTTGFMGRGMINDIRSFMPVSSEFVFAYIIYAFGWLVSGMLAAVIGGFIWRMLKISGKIRDSYGKLIMTAFVSVIIIRFIWSILMILGLLPLLGISMPIISPGGTNYVIDMMMLGIMMSIYRRKNTAIIKCENN